VFRLVVGRGGGGLYLCYYTRIGCGDHPAVSCPMESGDSLPLRYTHCTKCRVLEYVEPYIHAPHTFMAWRLDSGTTLFL
jgi:hypothetical protein